MTSSKNDDLDAQIAQTRPPLVVRAGAGIMVLSGLVNAFFALQMWMGPNWREAWLNYMPFVIVALCALQLFIALKLSIGLRWAAFSALGLGLVVLLFLGGWFGFLAYHGVYSLLGVVAVGFSFLALAAAPFTLEPAGTVTKARNRVRESGLELGF